MSTKDRKSAESQTTYGKGYAYEKQVAYFLKRYWKEATPEVQTRVLSNGLSVKRPYEIDVHVHVKATGLSKFFGGNDVDIWVECKWKEKTAVKRAEIQKLVASAQDVYDAAKVGREDMWYDHLIVSSNERFDSDALNYARQNGVLCIRYDGHKLIEVHNNDEWHEEEPRWLKG